MLTLENVSFKRKNQYLLSGINGKIQRGDCITIFGPNGAGKSTLIQVMAGLLRPSKGKRKSAFIKKDPIGYVPQQLGLFDGLTVQDHLKLFTKLTKQKNDDFLDEMIHVLDLESMMDKRIDKLSGGMKRKINLAVGLIHQPEILFLDEAFVGVDLAAKYDMLQWLKKLNERGVTIVFITHDWNVIHALAKDIWVLDSGKLIDHIPLTHLRDHIPYKSGSEALKKMFESNVQY